MLSYWKFLTNERTSNLLPNQLGYSGREALGDSMKREQYGSCGFPERHSQIFKCAQK